jgi:hypothetical protein
MPTSVVVKAKRTPRFSAGAHARLLAMMLILATASAAAQSREGFESPPVLAGIELAPGALLKSPSHTVVEPVSLDGYFGRFMIESKFGKFSVVGESMLAVRVHELAAIEALQNVQQSQSFQDALLKSASAPIQFVQSAVTDPAKTVENVAQGLGSVLGRIGFLAKSGVETIADTVSDQNAAPAQPGSASAPAGETAPSAFTGDPFGYNKARREWAKKLDIDPYTSNPVLRPLLDKAAAASFAGSFAVNTALGAVSMPVNVAIEMDTSVRDEVWNTPAVDLAKSNEAKLLAMGVAGRTTRDFLRNTWFTPTLQTALVSALAKLPNVGGIDSVIQVASQLQGETRVRFLVQSVRMLVRYHEKDSRFATIAMSNLVPVGITTDGTRVAGIAIDYAYWDKTAAEFAQRKDLAGKRRVLLVAGKASHRAKQEFARARLTLHEGLRP